MLKKIFYVGAVLYISDPYITSLIKPYKEYPSSRMMKSWMIWVKLYRNYPITIT